jgi:hypothetical protein
MWKMSARFACLVAIVWRVVVRGLYSMSGSRTVNVAPGSLRHSRAHCAAMQLHKVTHNREAQPQPTMTPRAAAIGLTKTLKNVR